MPEIYLKISKNIWKYLKRPFSHQQYGFYRTKFVFYVLLIIIRQFMSFLENNFIGSCKNLVTYKIDGNRTKRLIFRKFSLKARKFSRFLQDCKVETFIQKGPKLTLQITGQYRYYL